MVKLEAVELFLQASDRLAIRVHLRIMVARLFHDLVDDESGVASDVEPLDPKFDRDMETVDKGLIFRCIVRGGEVESDCISHPYPEGEMKMRPAPAPVFIKDPSKYKVQHSCWICGGGS